MKITMNEKGLFLARERKMTARGIHNIRVRLQNDIIHARERSQFWTHEIEILKEDVKEINSPVVNDYLADLERTKHEAEAKSQQLLHDFIGEQAYKELLAVGKISFVGNDGLKYQVNSRGHVFRGGRRLCIIRPTELPLPDFVVAALVNVREHPNKFPFRR